MNQDDLLNYLFKKKDLKYKTFNDRIINTKTKTIGVRTPIIKEISKKIFKADYQKFLDNYKSNYYEEILIEGFVISYIKDPKEVLKRLDNYLNKVDNWAICDLVCSSCKVLLKDKESTFLFIKKNLLSKNIWKVRFSFVLLLNYFIEEKYIEEIFRFINEDKNDNYYITMAKAWLISICFIKLKDKTLLFLKETNIDKETYNKSISKICDSYRVSKEDKILLKNMKKLYKKA